MKQQLAALALASCLAAAAAPITPEQALALLPASGASRIAASGQAPVLAETLRDTAGQPTVYVFATASGGYVITAADDAVSPVMLGYGDSALGDMPPAMRYWLTQYSDAVAALAASSATFRAPQHARQAIAKLCATTWNQGAPYNNDCPVTTGRCVTGCVATAIAQMMKVYNYPVHGTGSHTYSWTSGGHKYTASFNYDSYDFQWDNMLNSYPSSTSGTAAQRSAVSQLMKAVGVSCDMSYSPDGSGSNGVKAGIGLITYLGYDPSLQYLMRKWYTTDEWEALVYDELAAGHPVYMSGNDGTVGHAFVCDGNDGSAYFHFNWGWGGYYDGYFLLSNLNPGGTGTGGGSGDVGYDNDVAILAGMKPDAGGTPAACFDLTGRLQTNNVAYSRSATITVSGGSGAYFFCYTPGSYSYTFGVRLEDADGHSTWVDGTSSNGVLEPYYGYSSFSVSGAKFPEGDFKMYPAAKAAGGEWYDMHVDAATSPRYLHCSVTAEGITVTSGDVALELSSEFVSYTPEHDTDGDHFYTSHAYTFDAEVCATETWSGPIYCTLTSNASGEQLCASAPQTVTFPAAGIVDTQWTLTIPADAAPGDYLLALNYTGEDGQTVIIRGGMLITVEELPTLIDTQLLSFSPENSESSATLYYGVPYTFNFAMCCNIDYQGTVCAKLLKRVSIRYSVVATGDDVSANLPEGQTVNLSLPLTMIDGSSKATYYIAAYYTDADGKSQMVEMTPVKFNAIVKPESSLEAIGTDAGQAPMQLYDLQGRPVGADTAAPGLYIQRGPEGSSLIRR